MAEKKISPVNVFTVETKTKSMTTILQVSEDVLFVVLAYTTPLDFLSLSQTCLHFSSLNDSKKHPQINKYWQQQCECFWKLINKNNYKPKNYNYKCLFESMANFSVLTDEDHGMKRKVLLLIQAYKMKIRLNDIFCKETEDYTLGMIIKHDNLKMFKIYTCNMNDDDINTHKVRTRFDSKSILFAVVTSNPPAMKIANYLLAPVEIAIPIDDDKKKNNRSTDINVNNTNYNTANSDTKNSNIETQMHYNFPNIDVSSAGSTYNDMYTPLTIASHRKHVEIVSLLLNHPNMTKSELNKSDYFGQTPLHRVATSIPKGTDTANININAEQDAVKIAQMLLNDERTNVNSINGNNSSTPLMYAIRTQPKVAQILIDNEKVDVNIRSHFCGTALHVAIKAMMTDKDCKKHDVISQLIKKLLSRKDFDKNIKNDCGETGLDLAKKANLSQIVKILKLDNSDKE